MMIFTERDQEDIGTWFPYVDSRFDVEAGTYVYAAPVPGTARFRLRGVIPFYTARIAARKKQHQMVLNTGSRAMERVGYYEDLSPDEDKKELEDARDFMVTGIEGARWAEGAPEMECTRENKLKLFRIPAFDRFVTRCLILLSGVERKEAAAASENLPPG